jgi:hypothetical protein
MAPQPLTVTVYDQTVGLTIQKYSAQKGHKNCVPQMLSDGVLPQTSQLSIDNHSVISHLSPNISFGGNCLIKCVIYIQAKKNLIYIQARNIT